MRHTLSALLTLALAACAGNDSTRMPTAPGGDRDVATSGAGGAGGAVIIRDLTRAQFIDYDAEHQLLSVHLPVWDLWLCGGSSFPDVVERKRIITPSDVDQFLVQIRNGESSVGVFHAASLAEAGIGASIDRPVFCAFINGPALIAQGTVRHIQNLSNGSFTAHWGGTLTGPGGQLYSYSEAYQLTADTRNPNDASQWVEHVTRINMASIGR